MVTDKDRVKYTNALGLFTDISRTRGSKFSTDTILECIRALEYFEEYEKCMTLKEILNFKKNEGRQETK